MGDGPSSAARPPGRLCRWLHRLRRAPVLPLRRRQVANDSVVVIISFGEPIDVQFSSEPTAGRFTSFVAGLHDGFALTEHGGRQAGVEPDSPLWVPSGCSACRRASSLTAPSRSTRRGPAPGRACRPAGVGTGLAGPLRAARRWASGGRRGFRGGTGGCLGVASARRRARQHSGERAGRRGRLESAALHRPVPPTRRSRSQAGRARHPVQPAGCSCCAAMRRRA